MAFFVVFRRFTIFPLFFLQYSPMAISSFLHKSLYFFILNIVGSSFSFHWIFFPSMGFSRLLSGMGGGQDLTDNFFLLFSVAPFLFV